MFGVQGEMDADVLARVFEGRVTSPRCWHHDRCARGEAVAQGTIDADVGGVARPEVVAGEDDQLGVGRMTEAFGERAHGGQR